MKKSIKYLPVLLLSMWFTSCLKSDLEELPTFSDAEITNFRFEYRWIDDSLEFNQLRVIQLQTDTSINEDTNAVNCSITVPPTNGDFPQEIRDQVTLSNLVGYADISTAATMAATQGGPELGEISDFSTSQIQYEVTAADGSKKTWNLTIDDFNK